MRRHHTLLPLLLASLLPACSAAPASGTVAAAAPTPATATPPAAAKPADESLTIAFAEGAAKLSPEANEQLDTAARLYRDAKPEVMIIAGHTDTTGSEFQNLVLSGRRASLVKQALVDRGVPASVLQIVAIGEAEPVVGVLPSRSAVVTWR